MHSPSLLFVGLGRLHHPTGPGAALCVPGWLELTTSRLDTHSASSPLVHPYCALSLFPICVFHSPYLAVVRSSANKPSKLASSKYLVRRSSVNSCHAFLCQVNFSSTTLLLRNLIFFYDMQHRRRLHRIPKVPARLPPRRRRRRLQRYLPRRQGTLQLELMLGPAALRVLLRFIRARPSGLAHFHLWGTLEKSIPRIVYTTRRRKQRKQELHYLRLRSERRMEYPLVCSQRSSPSSYLGLPLSLSA